MIFYNKWVCKYIKGLTRCRELFWLRGLGISMAQSVGFLWRPHADHLTKPQHLRQYDGVHVDSPVYQSGRFILHKLMLFWGETMNTRSVQHLVSYSDMRLIKGAINNSGWLPGLIPSLSTIDTNQGTLLHL